MLDSINQNEKLTCVTRSSGCKNVDWFGYGPINVRAKYSDCLICNRSIRESKISYEENMKNSLTKAEIARQNCECMKFDKTLY